MTELSGTLEGVGLPAIVRFLSGLKKTGCLRVVHRDWHGEIYFDMGQVIGASLGSRQGPSALDALVEVLPGGSFAFDGASRLVGEANISLSSDALQAHLDDLAVQLANRTSRLPSLDVVPALLTQDNSSSGEEPLPLDRGTLQTLLAVDGRRSVREIVAQRGSLDALWQLANLVEVGLIQLSSEQAATPIEVEPSPPTLNEPEAPPAVEPIAFEPERLAPSPARPIAAEPIVIEATAHCPKLGFEDDSSNSFGRPTRLHRCFAAGTPLPLSLDQQRELCLSDQFATCPRLTMGAFVPPARDPQPGSSLQGLRRPSGPLPEPDAGDSRIVRLPFAARSDTTERGTVTDRHVVGGAEPARFRAASAPARDPAPTPLTPPTPLRARLERANGFGLDSAVAEPPTLLTPEPRVAVADAVDQTIVQDPVERRFVGVPAGVIAGAAVVLVVLAVIVFLLGPHVGDWFADDTLDPSTLPNASAVAAGTPIAEVAAAHATTVARATAVSAGTEASEPATTTATTTTGATAPSAASASGAAPVPTLAPEPVEAAAQPAAAQPAGGPSGAARAGAAQPAATSTVLDERFSNNDRNWPSSAQGTAFVSNGSYRLATRQANQFVAIGAPIVDALKDVVVNATFHKLNGPLGGGYGIIVRDQAAAPQTGTSQDGHYYVLEVGDKGEVGMWRRDGGQWVDLLPWQANAAVKPDTASNDVSVRAIGNRLTMTVNGILVAAKTDEAFSSGGVGLFVGGDGNQVAVDRFSIQMP